MNIHRLKNKIREIKKVINSSQDRRLIKTLQENILGIRVKIRNMKLNKKKVKK